MGIPSPIPFLSRLESSGVLVVSERVHKILQVWQIVETTPLRIEVNEVLSPEYGSRKNSPFLFLQSVQ